ncbi:hypothetical protein [Mesorhizobium sp.]|nr:hypothetical protein [Mesorhizobium sp.]
MTNADKNLFRMGEGSAARLADFTLLVPAQNGRRPGAAKRAHHANME